MKSPSPQRARIVTRRIGGVLALGLVMACAAAAREPPDVATLRARQDADSAVLFAEAKVLLQATKDPERQAWLKVALAEFENDHDRGDAALVLLNEVRHFAVQRDDHELHFAALAQANVIYTNRGRSEPGDQVLAQMQTLVERTERRDWRATLLHDRGVLARKLGDYDAAQGWFQQALSTARDLDAPLMIARELNSIGTLHGRTGRFSEALLAHQEAIELSRQAGARAETARGLRLLGVLFRNLDDEELGSDHLQQALANVDPRNRREAISVSAELAKSLTLLGQLDRAEVHAREAVRLAEDSGNAPNRVTAYSRMAELLLEQDRIDEAVKLAEMIDSLLGTVAIRDQLLLRFTRAKVWAAAGKTAAALPEAERCVDDSRRIGDRILERSALDFLAELQLTLGDAASAYVSRKAWQALDKSMSMDMAARRIAVLQAKAERDRDHAARALLERDNRIQVLSLNRQRTLAVALGAGLVSMGIIAVLLYGRYRNTKRLNAEITSSRNQLANLHTALANSAADLERAALTDALTGVANRRALVISLRETHQAAVQEGRALAVVIVDVDHFKQINDRHGHLSGDTVLGEVARRLHAVVSPPAIVGRWGGEEFLVVLPGHVVPEALAVGERMRRSLHSSPVKSDDQSVVVTASFGVSGMPPGAPRSINALLAAADQALYAAKAHGRNRVECDPGDAWVCDPLLPTQNLT